MTYVEFFGNSYFLAWCSLWLWWGIPYLVILLISLVSHLIINLRIMIRGYRPPEVQAPEPEVETTNND